MKIKQFTGFVFFSLFITMSNISCTTTNDYALGPLSKEQKDDLIFLREEEKLGRDVFAYAYQKYGYLIYKNESENKQYYMDKILDLFNLYRMQDPVPAAAGAFSIQELQLLYDSLIAQIDQSAVNALNAGAIIEEKTTYDVIIFDGLVEDPDVSALCNEMRCSSENYLRIFYRFLVNNQLTYSAHYLSPQQFQQVINGNYENCQ